MHKGFHAQNQEGYIMKYFVLISLMLMMICLVPSMCISSNQPDNPQIANPNLINQFKGRIAGVSFSPNDKVLVTSGMDGTIRIWGMENWKELKILRTGEASFCVTFTPDGKNLATSVYGKGIILWSVKQWKKIGLFTGPHSVMAGAFITFSPDGKKIASGWGKRVIIWNTFTHKQLHVIRGFKNDVVPVVFSPNGRLLATGDYNGTIRIWRVSDWRCVRRFTDIDEIVESLAFSPNSKLMAYGDGRGTVRVWKISSWRCIKRFTDVGGVVESLTFSPNGNFMAAGYHNGAIRIWNTLNWKLVHIATGHKRAVLRMAFSYDGKRLASASNDGTVRIWNTKNWNTLRVIIPIAGRSYPPDDLRQNQ